MKIEELITLYLDEATSVAKKIELLKEIKLVMNDSNQLFEEQIKRMEDASREADER
jgi:hypothetical protein